MDEQEPNKRQTTLFSRAARDRRIFDRAREGFPYDEIGREEGLSAERVRQTSSMLWKERAARRSGPRSMRVFKMDRVGEAMRVAGEALRRGEVRAIGPFLKAVAQLNGYRRAAAGLDLVGREPPPEAPDLQALAEGFAELLEDEGNDAAAALAKKLAEAMKTGELKRATRPRRSSDSSETSWGTRESKRPARPPHRPRPRRWRRNCGARSRRNGHQPIDKTGTIAQIFPNLFQGSPNFSKREPNLSKFSCALPKKT